MSSLHGAAASCGGPPAGRPPHTLASGAFTPSPVPDRRPRAGKRQRLGEPRSPLYPPRGSWQPPSAGRPKNPTGSGKGEPCKKKKTQTIPRRERGPAWLGRLGAASPLGLPRGRPTPPELGTNWAKTGLLSRGERFGPSPELHFGPSPGLHFGPSPGLPDRTYLPESGWD